MSVAAQLTIGRSRWTKPDQPGGAAGLITLPLNRTAKNQTSWGLPHAATSTSS